MATSQAVRECDRCVATTKSGAQCRNRTCRGQKCWLHTKSQDGLRIKPSQVANGGFGLHTTKRFPAGAKLADYAGEKLTRAQVGQKYNMRRGEYVVCRNDNECFDGARTNSSFARYANDARGTPFVNNARFTPGRTAPILRATRAIPADREIFVSYRGSGGDYWK
jgi:hypothetical protein